MKTILAKIKSGYLSLPPTTKKKLSFAAMFGLIVLIGVSVYKEKDNNSSTTLSGEKTVREISLDPNLVQNTIFEETRKKTSEMEIRQKELEKNQEITLQKIDHIDQLLGKYEYTQPINQQPTSPHPSGRVSQANRRANGAGSSSAFPPIPDPDLVCRDTSFGPPPPPGPPRMQASYRVIGSISTVSNKSVLQGGINSQDEDSKKNEQKKKYYLPPCFLQATLLSGLRAPTMGDAKKDPVPILLRVKTPAILPNHVRSNISGCYIIAEGSGKLSDERVHVRLLSLSCIDRYSQSIIDQNITGFVQDEDGVVGLSGIVTAKFGSKIARAFLAGAIEGAGDAMQTATSTVETTPVGTTQIISETDTRNIARAAVGGGLSTASKELQTFYYNLAKESMPVLEVGNNKPCTVVISKGVYLDVKNEEILR